MSLRRLLRIRHSLAFRLTLWYASIFTATSFMAFVFFYMLITLELQRRIDQELLTQMRTFSSIMDSKGVDAVASVAKLEARKAGEKKYFFRVYYNFHWMYFSSDKLYWRHIDISLKALERLVDGENRVFETVVIPEHNHRIRILYGSIGIGVILQIGYSMEDHTRFTDAFKKIFVFTMSFLVLLAAFIGWFMARQALSNLAEITETARHISHGDFEKRVSVKSKGREIDLLATSFNQMLNRIQTLLMGIKEMGDNIAHDLKSPITRIRGISEITLTAGTSLDEYKNMAASTIEECDRLLDMINTMMVISETEAGVSRPESKEVDISGIVQSACELFQPIAEDKNLTITCDTPDRCFFPGNTRMIQRMIANLIDNGIKYTPAGGSIEISTQQTEEQPVIVLVKDTGIGISEKDLPHIFERFYRCDPSRSEAGIGLGLSLALAIARAHGGDITVDSTPGKGSTFMVTLPK